MCGIVGIISRNDKGIYNPEQICEMMEKQKHRGPDDEGICGFSWGNEGIDYTGEKIAGTEKKLNGVIGFNRLSIQDLSIRAHQPMMDQKHRVILAFNGEIYNSDKLREQTKNYKYISSSDTETILALYLQYGIKETVKKLNGMFAIVIVDLNEDKIYIVRDRMGIKPLYYYVNDEIIALASEIKSLLPLDSFKAKCNVYALYESFIYRGCCNQKTLFQDVRLIGPGEIISIDAKGNLKSERYFNIDDYEKRKYRSYKEFKNELGDVLKDAVERQLVSDVKVGTQLSGGVDSSLVAYYLHELNNDIKDAFSIIFDNEEYSEEKYIDQVAKRESLIEHKYMFNDEDFYRNYEKSIWHMEGISTIPNCMGLMHLCMNAKKDVTVLLSGEGADESWAGYEQFVNVWKLLRKHKDVVAAEKYITRYSLVIPRTCLEKVFGFDNIDSYFMERDKIYSQFEGDCLTKQIKYELATYLPELLIRQDKMSMAASVENRVPLLDNDVIDFALTTPSKYIIRQRKEILKKTIVGKFPLKDIATDVYGKEFSYREKMGFAMPIGRYLKDRRFINYYNNEIKVKMRERGLLDEGYITGLFDKIDQMKPYEVELLWRAVSFEVWCQLFVDKRAYREIGE